MKAMLYTVWDTRYPEIYYLGSLVDGTLSSKWSVHKNNSKTRNSKFYRYLRDNLDHMKIELFFAFEVGHRDDAIIVEDEWIRFLNPCLNTNFPIKRRERCKVCFRTYHSRSYLKKHKCRGAA